MRAWVVNETDPAGRLGLETRPPLPAEAGLLIDVRAAGVGFPDLMMRRGEFQIRQPVPFTLGWELAGTVRHAPDESGFEPGDRVCGISFGAFAEQVIANPDVTFALPRELSFDEGAAARLAQMVETGGVRPIVGNRFRFEDLEQGLCALSRREATGKQVLVVGGDQESARIENPGKRSGAGVPTDAK